MINFKIKLLPGGIPPSKAHESDAGWDLYACSEDTIEVNSRILMPVGFCISLPEGYEAQIRPRSGLALKYGITVLNSPGTIDAGFRSEIQVILQNCGYYQYQIKKGDRIAQMVIKAVEPSQFEIVEELDDTDRGESGFGSSGL